MSDALMQLPKWLYSPLLQNPETKQVLILWFSNIIVFICKSFTGSKRTWNSSQTEITDDNTSHSAHYIWLKFVNTVLYGYQYSVY